MSINKASSKTFAMEKETNALEGICVKRAVLTSKRIPTLGTSNLLQRRGDTMKCKPFSCLTIGTIKSAKKKNPFAMISKMKSKVIMEKQTISEGTLSTTYEESKDKFDCEYIFQRHVCDHKETKEKNLAKFLDTTGIFQINLKVVLDEYHF
ncbi:unnamed protein product [Moneuplotes crassus]|uniref:Uncharacterized protein n=1 Tax=Euplotes crassus TaxID=5936 RepID=A0AAD2CWH8_EUPCR|nr:unnamed protein product [Moneuplotes crassus]